MNFQTNVKSCVYQSVPPWPQPSVWRLCPALVEATSTPGQLHSTSLVTQVSLAQPANLYTN